MKDGTTYYRLLWVFNLAWGSSFNPYKPSSVRAYKFSEFTYAPATWPTQLEPIQNSNEMIVMNKWSIISVDGTSGFNNLFAYQIGTESVTETDNWGFEYQTPIYNLAAYSHADSTGTSLYALQLKEIEKLRIVQMGDLR